MPSASSTVYTIEDCWGADNGGSFSTGSDGTLWQRKHVAGLAYWPAWRFVIPTATYDLIQAGTGITAATVSTYVTHANMNGTHAVNIYAGPDTGPPSAPPPGEHLGQRRHDDESQRGGKRLRDPLEVDLYVVDPLSGWDATVTRCAWRVAS